MTVDDFSKAYADFEIKNKKMLDKLAEDNNKIFAGYTVDTFIDIVNKLYACENNPYMLSRVSDKNKVLYFVILSVFLILGEIILPVK